jgi:hypothetical protein
VGVLEPASFLRKEGNRAAFSLRYALVTI